MIIKSKVSLIASVLISAALVSVPRISKNTEMTGILLEALSAKSTYTRDPESVDMNES